MMCKKMSNTFVQHFCHGAIVFKSSNDFEVIVCNPLHTYCTDCTDCTYWPIVPIPAHVAHFCAQYWNDSVCRWRRARRDSAWASGIMILGLCYIAPKFAISHLGYIAPLQCYIAVLYIMLSEKEQVLYSRWFISVIMWYMVWNGKPDI